MNSVKNNYLQKTELKKKLPTINSLKLPTISYTTLKLSYTLKL